MTWDHLNTWAYGIFITMLSGFIYLVRIVFTNQTELKLLRQQIETQKEYRIERDAKLDNQLLELRSDIKTLIRKA